MRTATKSQRVAGLHLGEFLFIVRGVILKSQLSVISSRFSVWAEALLQPSQTYVCEYGQGGGWNGASQDYLIIDHGQSAKNVFAQTAGADGGSDGCQSNGKHGGNPHARDDYAQG